MNSRFLLISALVITLFASSAAAQIPVSSGGLELSASSNNPAPGQTVTVTARSYTIDINAAKVSWYVDGKLTKSAAGITELQIKAPALGKKTVIDVSATDSNGVTVRSSITIDSGSIDLIYETDGYVPPFFKGKIAPSFQNTITIIAVPHIANSSGVEYDPSTLVYQWKKGSQVLEGQSGYGKQSITITGDIIPRPFDISVSAWPRDTSTTIETFATIEMGAPDIKFYIDDPLYGPLFNRSIGTLLRIGSNKETTVLAVPYGFNKPQNGTGDLELGWGINGTGVPSLSGKESIVLRSPNDSSGSSNVQLNVRNIDKILQGGTGSFSASFGSNKQEVTPSF